MGPVGDFLESRFLLDWTDYDPIMFQEICDESHEQYWDVPGS